MIVPSNCTVCAMPFDSARTGFLDPFAQAMLGHQRIGAAAAFLDRKPAQGAHERNRFAAVHRRVKAALLGKIADFVRGKDRPVAAEQAERPDEGSMIPSSILSRVVLPAPLGPRRP